MTLAPESGSTTGSFLRSRLGVAAAGVALAGVALAGATAGAAGAGSLPAGSPGPSSIPGTSRAPIANLRHSTSSNWSGYAAYGSAGKFSSVTATWVQPTVSCGSQNTYSSYWAGLDGYNSSTVEQLGTEADCSGGSPTFYAWYEMYPHRGYYINTVNVKAGDSYTASVAYRGSGNFVLTLTDNNTHASFSTTQKLGSAKLSSAEAIVEAPYSGGVLPLADFGTVNFSGVNANGSPLGGFSPLDPITMNNPYGMVATPSKFSSGNTAFSVSWSAS